MRKRILKTIVFILLCSLILTNLSFAEEITIGEKTQSHYNNTQPVQMLLGTEGDNEEENIPPAKEKIAENSSSYGLTAEQIDLVTNIVMHEVGSLYGSNIIITMVLADGTTIDYSGTNMIHKIHAKVLLNQYYSSIFPNSLSSCISQYWASYLANANYYNHNNSTWKDCRQDVINVLSSGSIIPSNVYVATCDPYFASYYSGYSLYATVYWNTGWYSGTFYYYQYN